MTWNSQLSQPSKRAPKVVEPYRPECCPPSREQQRRKHIEWRIALALRAVADPPHPSKRANWLKFCHRCGADISHTPRGVRLCTYCNPATMAGQTTTAANQSKEQQ